ncbi:MAG TPA: GTPase HflX [Candidatus Cloacimonadota bacterium]|nr:GTPase HflX [Candidatus Cloacimonadota bacterium]
MLHETTIKENTRAIIVGVCLSNRDAERINYSLQELHKLVETADYEVVSSMCQNRKSIDKRHYLGKGFVAEIKERMLADDIAYLIFDDEISPSQQANLEKDFDIKVLDRTQIIMKIFYKHAQSSEARLQIRLAELQYELPRLKQSSTAFDRISGGAAGGMAAKGAGEMQINLDRTNIRKEITLINEKLEKILVQKNTQSKQRERINRVCLVGYTNAGKSTLFNRLTQSDVLVEDKLFATLDSTVRSLSLSKYENFVITDTVGFIAKLPHTLVASFRATLKEAQDADLLLHVVDASQPDFAKQMSEVNTVLNEIEADHVPVLLVFNKIDKLKPEERVILSNTNKKAVLVSAETGLNIENLVKQIEDFFILEIDYQLMIPYKEQKLIAQLHRIAEVKEIEHLENGVRMLIRLDSSYKDLVEKYVF